MTTRLRVQPVRDALDFGPRPRPADGIFETVLVAGGRTPLLGAHLARLAASALELYGVTPAPLPTPLPDLPGGGRLRVRCTATGRLSTDVGPLGPDPSYSAIAPFVLPGGLGPHKWLDRHLLEALGAAAGPHGLPLLLDDDGAVLESAWANVLIEERGRLISPPFDGRFRPGFGRAGLRYGEEPVDFDRLLASDALVLTSALRVLRIPLR